MNSDRGLQLKVLQIGPLPPPVGGMASVVKNLGETLPAFCQVRVLNNAKTTPEKRSLVEGILAQLSLLRTLAMICLAWRPKLVHIHTCSWFSFWRNAVDVAVARLLGRRVVLHIHGGQFRRFLGSLGPVRGRMARLAFRFCARVIVLGDDWKELLNQWCESERVVAVPNGVLVPPARHRNFDAILTIICLANYESGKGQRDLLEAAATLREPRLRVALLGAETQPGERQALLQHAANLGLADRVDIPGPVVGAVKEGWWGRAACFCLPSYDEGLPMSMLEAMARCIPVVVTRVGAVPEAVDDGKEGLLYEAGDVTALAAHLAGLLNDPTRAETIGRAGRERVIRDFSLERTAARLLAIYQDAIR